MKRRREDDLILACVAFGLLMALVAVVKVMLSPMVATFVAGLGIGAMGVLASMRVQYGKSGAGQNGDQTPR